MQHYAEMGFENTNLEFIQIYNKACPPAWKITVVYM